MTENAQVFYSICLVRYGGNSVIQGEKVPPYCIKNVSLFYHMHQIIISYCKEFINVSVTILFHCTYLILVHVGFCDHNTEIVVCLLTY